MGLAPLGWAPEGGGCQDFLPWHLLRQFFLPEVDQAPSALVLSKSKHPSGTTSGPSSGSLLSPYLP